MPTFADAHIHLFDPGFVARLPESCRRRTPSELALYDELTRLYNIDSALVVGYEGEAWAAGNNRYLASLVHQYTWLHPLAFVQNPADLTLTMLQAQAADGFVGISLYLFDERVTEALSRVPGEVWQWLAARRQLISVNAKGDTWRAWEPVLADHPQLRLLVAHLGLPEAVSTAPDPVADPVNPVRRALEPVLALAQAPHVYVKLSAFYALSHPQYAYPHTDCWPYVELLRATFGSHRLLWGSDFSPALEWISFPQTLHVLETMPFFSPAERQAIQAENLHRLLTATSIADTATANSHSSSAANRQSATGDDS